MWAQPSRGEGPIPVPRLSHHDWKLQASLSLPGAQGPISATTLDCGHPGRRARCRTAESHPGRRARCRTPEGHSQAFCLTCCSLPLTGVLLPVCIFKICPNVLLLKLVDKVPTPQQFCVCVCVRAGLSVSIIASLLKIKTEQTVLYVLVRVMIQQWGLPEGAAYLVTYHGNLLACHFMIWPGADGTHGVLGNLGSPGECCVTSGGQSCPSDAVKGLCWVVNSTELFQAHHKAGDVHKGISIFLQTHREGDFFLSYLIKISVSCRR